jgi:hypothetical protein
VIRNPFKRKAAAKELHPHGATVSLHLTAQLGRSSK